MMFKSVMNIALLCFGISTSVTAFGEGGSLPADHFIYGPMNDTGAGLAKRVTSSTSTTAASSAACTFGATSRNCWSSGYSVATDFDQKWPTTGVTRYYTFTISNTTCNPDGNGKKDCILVNGAYPGPAITANWGDMISVTVNNNLKNNGTDIHWHGLRQLNTNIMDGVPGVTECPLAPGQSQTYTFQATQFGTSWYHSHFAAQYGNGVAGPIVIAGPASANYDLDMGPLIVNDWYYQTADQVDDLFVDTIQTGAAGPAGSNILINGTNKNVAGTTGSYLATKLTTGKKHLFRLINMSVDNAIRVSLDGHQLQVITSDFVPIEPIFVDSLLVGVGQRYEVIITANQTARNYWFRAEAESAGCSSFNDGIGLSIFTYSTVTKATPTTVSTYTNGGVCDEPSPMTPWVVNQVGSEAEFISQAGDLTVGFLVPGVTTNNQSIISWGINFTAINVQWNDPVLSYVMAGDNNFPTTEALIELTTESIWVFWIIQEVLPSFEMPHPIHLHGHDFYVLGRGVGTFDYATDPQTLQYNNPTRRDTAILPAGGWMVLAFTTDNPGAWLMHCHIAWHISEGLGVQFLEAAEDIILPGSAYTTQCADWTTYAKTMKYAKSGSGL